MITHSPKKDRTTERAVGKGAGGDREVAGGGRGEGVDKSREEAGVGNIEETSKNRG